MHNDALKQSSNNSEHAAVLLSCRVLVIDDREEVRQIADHFLSRAGATVKTANDGRQGFDLALAAQQNGVPFDAVIMDIQMPDINGLDCVRMLRSKGIQVPVIALTADAMKGDREKCIMGGCDDYLPKPIDQNALVEMVRQYTQVVTCDELNRQRNRINSDQSP